MLQYGEYQSCCLSTTRSLSRLRAAHTYEVDVIAISPRENVPRRAFVVVAIPPSVVVVVPVVYVLQLTSAIHTSQQ